MMFQSLSLHHSLENYKLQVAHECAEKTAREGQGGLSVGVWAELTPPRIPVLLLQLTFFSVDSAHD